MEIGESAALALVRFEDAECPCEHEKPGKVTGKPKGEKSVAELRRNMKAGTSTRQWVEKGGKYENGESQTDKDPLPGYEVIENGEKVGPIQIGDDRYPLSMAAHHIIPGKDALPKSDIRKFLWEAEGKTEGDVGYDVDGAENGVWLPTHAKLSSALGKSGEIQICDEDNPSQTLSYADLSQRPPKRKEGGEWVEVDDRSEAPLNFIETYTRQAMKLTGRQFHDSHSAYSGHVTKRLNKMHVKMCHLTKECPECQKAEGEKLPPPYGLVDRLNALSLLLRVKLLGPPASWVPPIFTSHHARGYRDDARSFRVARRGRR